MKVNAATLTLAVGVAAQPNIMARNASTITSVLSSVFTAMTNADNQLLAYHGGLPTSLRDASTSLYNTLQGNIETLQNMDPLTHDDVIAITNISTQVTTIGGKYLEDLGAAAPIFEANGICDYLYNYSISLGTVVNDFFTAAKTKFPAEDQEYAAQEIEHTNAIFAKAQAALAPGACVNEVAPPEQSQSSAEPDPPKSTSVAWQTPTGWHGGAPTSAPGSGNGTGNGNPPTPIIGAGSALGPSSGALALIMAAVFLL
ncbi:hypothetical protein HD806DRAFT_318989 [Xylariaceae sp. AK1471]|nr:hypothetical protein HD806DRAFT_318989 [Xylariaceae sp. AK1471]